MSNILYYSKRCQHCKSMIINISQSPVKSQIQFVCVDDLIKNGTLPSFIKSVPTIFKRDTNSLLKGDAANEWIKSFDQSGEGTDDIGGFGGFSNFGGAYSGLSEDGGYGGSFSTGDSFSFIGSDESPGQQQGPQQQQGETNSDMKSQKQQIMDSAYDKMMSERESLGNPIART